MRYFVFIDESGEANVNNLDPRFNVFVLCGIVFREDHYKIFDEELSRLKLKYFGDDSVIFHSYDMRKNKGVFKIFQDTNVLSNFYSDLEPILTKNEYKIISCIVDKVKYKEKYPGSNITYEESLKFLCERSISCIGSYKRKHSLHFCLEKRGNRKDRNLKKIYTEIVRYGTDYKSTSDFLVCHPNLFFRAKGQNINGLQLADLCAYPIARKVLSPKREQPTYNLFRNKIFCNKFGKKTGIGLKFFP